MLTSTSLMVTGESWEEAVELARRTPSLAVGLHLVLSDGRPVSHPETIPHLVNLRGRFSESPLAAGLRYAFERAARRELALEIAAQFDRFVAAGLPLSHVDGHQHLHIHPVVFSLLLPLALRFGAQGVRVPRDDFWLALRHDRRHVMTKAAWSVATGTVSPWCAHRLRGSPLASPHRVYGVMQSGHMHEEYVVAVLRQLMVPSAEIYFHPSMSAQAGDLGANPGDLAALLSPGLRSTIAERGLVLATYGTLRVDKTHEAAVR